jgi:hypothetical protein
MRGLRPLAKCGLRPHLIRDFVRVLGKCFVCFNGGLRPPNPPNSGGKAPHPSPYSGEGTSPLMGGFAPPIPPIRGAKPPSLPLVRGGHLPPSAFVRVYWYTSCFLLFNLTLRVGWFFDSLNLRSTKGESMKGAGGRILFFPLHFLCRGGTEKYTKEKGKKWKPARTTKCVFPSGDYPRGSLDAD